MGLSRVILISTLFLSAGCGGLSRKQEGENLNVVIEGLQKFEHLRGRLPHPTKSEAPEDVSYGNMTGPDAESLRLNPGIEVSWRVKILPYIGEGQLYSEYHLDEPWDSPHNLTLLEKMPAAFQTRGPLQKGFTGMRVVSGQVEIPTALMAHQNRCRTMFYDDLPLGSRFRDCTDGTYNTVFVVSAGPSASVEWTRPEVLELVPEDPFSVLGEPDSQRTFPVATMECARWLKEDLDPHLALVLFTCDDGEVISEY